MDRPAPLPVRPPIAVPVCPRLLLIAFLLAGSSPAPALGQNGPGVESVAELSGASGRVTLVGTVVDAVGAGVQGATVQVDGRDGGALTDRLGQYSLVGVPAGSITLRVTRLGYGTRERTLDVDTASSVVRADFVLEPEAVELEPLHVLAERTRLVGDPARLGLVTGAAHLLTARELERQPNAFGDVHAALRTLPGVYVQDEEGYGLRPNIGLRGSGVERSSRITLMEDGVLIAPAPYAAPAAYYFPTAARMEAVEVRKGSSQVKYGPRTIGGAVNLVSSAIPEGTGWTADLAGGSDNTFRARGRVGGTAGQFGWLLETFQIGTDGFKRLPGGGDTGFRLQDYMGKLRWRSPEGARVHQAIELKAGYTDQLSDETYLGLTDEDFATQPLARYAASANDLMDAEHNQLQLRHFLQLPSGLDLTTTAYRNGFRRNWYKLQSVLGSGISGIMDDPASNPTALAVLRGADSADGDVRLRANNRAYVSLGVETILGVRGELFGTRHELEIGVRLHRDDEDRFQWEDGYRMDAGRLVLTATGTPGSQSNRLAEARALSAFVQDRVVIGPLTLTPGVRFESVDFTRTDWAGDDPDRLSPERVRENGVTAWIPGVGAAYQATGALSVFGGVHRGFAPPGAGVDPATRPEESVNLEAGLRYRDQGLALSAAAFYSDYDNILGQASLASGGDGSGAQFNGGAVSMGGVEAAVDMDPLWGRATSLRLPLRFTYTWTSGRFDSAFESDFEPWGSVQPGDELPYLPTHQFSASAGLETPRWRIEASAFGNTATRTVAGQGPIPDGEGTDAFAVVNLSGELHLSGRGSLYLGIQNLLDQRYITARRPAGVRPGLPRTVMVGYRVSR